MLLLFIHSSSSHLCWFFVSSLLTVRFFNSSSVFPLPVLSYNTVILLSPPLPVLSLYGSPVIPSFHSLLKWFLLSYLLHVISCRGSSYHTCSLISVNETFRHSCMLHVLSFAGSSCHPCFLFAVLLVLLSFLLPFLSFNVTSCHPCFMFSPSIVFHVHPASCFSLTVLPALFFNGSFCHTCFRLPPLSVFPVIPAAWSSLMIHSGIPAYCSLLFCMIFQGAATKRRILQWVRSQNGVCITQGKCHEMI